MKFSITICFWLVFFPDKPQTLSSHWQQGLWTGVKFADFLCPGWTVRSSPLLEWVYIYHNKDKQLKQQSWEHNSYPWATELQTFHYFGIKKKSPSSSDWLFQMKPRYTNILWVCVISLKICVLAQRPRAKPNQFSDMNNPYSWITLWKRVLPHLVLENKWFLEPKVPV